MTPLAGQRILLIGIGFYDYEAAIATAFRDLGAATWVESEQPPEDRGALAPLRRRLRVGRAGTLARHLTDMLERIRALDPLDHIVVIKGALLDEDFLDALRVAQPTAQLVAYHWDSMARFPDLVQRQRLFDRVLTFDHADAAQNSRLLLRPLFFRPELSRSGNAQKPTIDLCFVGWLHHDRLRQVERIREQARELGLNTYFYLSTGSWTLAKLIVARHGQDVHSRPQQFKNYVERTQRSRAIVDLPHPRQTGLTMRAIEAVGAGRKLLTTAVDITCYDIYRPENIHILDPTTLHIDPAFLVAAAAPLPQELVARYSLRAWALDVLGVTEPQGFVGKPR